MTEWKETIIGEYIDLISGYAFKSANFINEYIENSLPVIKIKNVANGDTNLNDVVYHQYDASLEKFVLKKGDVLIAMTGNHPHAMTQVVGDVSRYKLETNSLLNQRVGKLVPKENTSLDFVYYLFKDKDVQNYLANQSSGSANQANISKGDILGLNLRIPPLPEQKAIAEILSSLDDKIDLLHRQNKTLEQMAETIFRQWFVERKRLNLDSDEFYDNHDSNNHKNQTNQKNHSSDNVEEAKEDWEEGVLSDLIVVKYGKDHKKLLDGNIPVLGSGGLMRYADTALYEKESVLIPRKGSLNNVMYIDEPFWTVDTMFYTEMKKSNIAKFIYHFVKELDLASMNVGSAVPSMTTEVLNNMPIEIPSDTFFQKFEEAIEPMYLKMKFNKKQIGSLEKMRNTLLPKLMSGEVTVQI